MMPTPIRGHCRPAAGRSRAVDRRAGVQRGRRPGAVSRAARRGRPPAAAAARSRHRGGLCRRRQPRRQPGGGAHPAGRGARHPGRVAVAQLRQGGSAAGGPRSCAVRRRAVHGWRRPASARPDPDPGRPLARRRQRRGLHRQGPSRQRVGDSAASACGCSIGCSTGKPRRRFPRMPATSGCCRRAPPMRCGGCPSATASSRGWRAGSASSSSASTTSRPSARTAPRAGAPTP